MRILDISPRISSRIAVWPGDTPFEHHFLCRIAEGANLDLSTVRTTVHLGAHADAPSHYVGDGHAISERDLARYLGPCELIRVRVERGKRILPEDLPPGPRARRVLFCTGTFPNPEQWNTDFAALSPELVDHLAAQGVVLVGIDTPSVDLFEDKVLLSHTAVARADMSVLEGLVLDGIAPGPYTLIALPLPIEGADASPVRAVLLPPNVLVAEPLLAPRD